jgi:hypothetical protein
MHISARRIRAALLRRGHATFDARQARASKPPRLALRRSYAAFDSDQGRRAELRESLVP